MLAVRRVKQTDAPLDDDIEEGGCAFLSGLKLSEQAGYPAWITDEETNKAFEYLVAAKIVRQDGFILDWVRFGDWLFTEHEMTFHMEGAAYQCKPGDFAEALYAYTDDKEVVHQHFIAAYPQEDDPYPNSKTRRIGRIIGYRVWTRKEKKDA